jgi:hypothetical protein
MKSTSARRRSRPPVDTSAYLLMVARIVAAAGQRVSDGDPEDLAALISLRAALDDAIIDAVRGLRDAGTTWEDIGAATGTTRQAAIMKWGPKLAS